MAALVTLGETALEVVDTSGRRRPAVLDLVRRWIRAGSTLLVLLQVARHLLGVDTGLAHGREDLRLLERHVSRDHFLQRRHELAEPFGRDRLVQLGHHRGDRRVLLLCTVGEIVAAVDPPAERRVERPPPVPSAE